MGLQLNNTVEEKFWAVTLEAGRRLRLENFIVVEWSIDYGDDRIYRKVTIGEVEDGQAVRVTDYRGQPANTPTYCAPQQLQNLAASFIGYSWLLESATRISRWRLLAVALCWTLSMDDDSSLGSDTAE